MKFPALKKIKRTVEIRRSFGGYVHNEGTPEGAFYDMENLTSDQYPLLCVRPKRAVWRGAEYDENGVMTGYKGEMLLTGLTAAVNAGDKLCYCSRSGVYINGVLTENCPLDPDVVNRSAVPFGRDLFIAPDGILIRDGGSGDLTVQTVAEDGDSMPVLDFAAEHNNRVWGCRYGENENGEFVNEIYASALGDPLTWRKYDGISTDSYCASLGSAGEFTGMATLGGDILFFKENAIIRVSGSTPSDFSVETFPARGVEKGAHNSIVNLNEKIFYKGRNGINVYDGALPYCISEDLGTGVFTDAAAGGVKGKYYVSMTDGEGRRGIFVYDTLHGTWHRENDSNTRRFVTVKNCLFAFHLDATMGAPLIPVYVFSLRLHDRNALTDPQNVFTGKETEPVQYADEDAVEWFALTGRLGAREAETRLLRTLLFRISTGEDAVFRVRAINEESGTDVLLYTTEGRTDGTVSIPVMLPRCDSYRLRLEGKGDCTVFSAAACYEKTNEVNMLGR